MGWRAAGVAVLVLVAPLGHGGQRSLNPTGFIDASMEWDFKDEYAGGGEIEDEGYCSGRLDLRAGGVVQASHEYQRTVTRKSWPEDPRGRRIETVTLTQYLSSQRLPFHEGNAPVPSVYEYQANPSLLRYRDGTYSLSLRRQTNPIRTVVEERSWRREHVGLQTRELGPPQKTGRVEHLTCDPIAELYRALLTPRDPLSRRRQLAPLPALTGDTTVAGMYTRAIEATIRARWELRP